MNLLIDRIFGKAGSRRRLAALATSWNVADLISGHFLRLASNLIMSRLLVPDAFGVMALVATFMTALELFTDIGISKSVVLADRADAHYLRVAWTTQLLRRALPMAAILLVAGVALSKLAPAFAPSGTAYADPQLPFLIMASSLLVIFRGGASANIWLSQRRMQFSYLFAINVTSQLSAIATMVVAAAVDPSVWALYTGTLCGAVVYGVLSHVVVPGEKMRFEGDRKIVGDLWKFGKWIVLSSSLYFVASNADRFVTAAVFDASVFGQYTIALTWVLAVRMAVQKISDSVSFPMLSEARRSGSIDSTFSKISAMNDAVVIGSFLTCVAVLPALIRFLYNEDYEISAEFVPALSLLLLAGHFAPLSSLVLSAGGSRTSFHASAASALLAAVLFPIGYIMFGARGVVLASVVVPTIAAGVMAWHVKSTGEVGYRLSNYVVWLVSVLLLAALLFPTLPL